MILNFFKIALRSFLKYKGFFTINVFGLAVGIACSVLILLFVQNELSYDTFHQNAERIYRLHIRASIGNTKFDQAYSSSENQRVFMEKYPELETSIKILHFEDVYSRINETHFKEDQLFAVDSNFFQFFNFELMEGDENEVLLKPNSIVLTEDCALKYFGRIDNLLGNEVEIQIPGGPFVSYTVTGISANTPPNSHFKYDYLLSSSSFPGSVNNRGWSSNNFRVYYKLRPASNIDNLETKMAEFVREISGGESYDEWVSQGNYWIYYFMPLLDIHLNSDVSGEFEANGNETYTYIILLISIIILLIACINFMNLTTAKSSVRAKEIGMRKILGSSKKKLIGHFMSESFLYSFIALCIGMAIVESILPYYNNFVDKHLDVSYFGNWYTFPILLTLWFVVGILSGLYPSFIMSSYKSLHMLKGNTQIGTRKGGMRNALVTFQFGSSVILIIATLVVYLQISFLMKKDLGFTKENILLVETPTEMHNIREEYKQLLLKNPIIESASAAASIPGNGWSNRGCSAEDVEQSFTLNRTSADEDFMETMKMELVEGRWFSKDMPSDSFAVVINETAVNALGWKDPVNKRLTMNGDVYFTVIGILKDIHYESLHGEVRPMGLFNLNAGSNGDNTNYIVVRYANGRAPKEAIQICQDAWSQLMGSTPFNYSFFDSDLERLYTRDKQTRKIFTVFSLLAILIASLGLLGLVSFVTERKTKEIGIRKAVGASAAKITGILNRSFLKWVALANLLAYPLAYYMMKKWLQNFAFHVNLSIWIFILATVISMVLAIMTISILVMRAANKNPVNSLRYE